MAIPEQQASFKNRVKRINATAGGVRGASIVGSLEDIAVTLKEERPNPVRTLFPMAEVYMLPFALIVGAACWLVARVILFQLTQIEGYFPTEADLIFATLVGDIAIAASVAIILRTVLNLKIGLRGWAQLAGFCGAIIYEGELIARFPSLFEVVYSDVYVAEIVSGLNAVL